MRIVLDNIGRLLSGDLAAPLLEARSLTIEDGRIAAIGGTPRGGQVDLSVDCRETCVGPGLVDTHAHPAFGDFAPKQMAVGYLESTVHGGVTRLVSAGEVHVPGRPGTAQSAKAIAIAAHDTFRTFRPLGLKVEAGALMLETDLRQEDVAEVARAGVKLVGEVGNASLKRPEEAVEMVRWATEAGLVVIMHAGGTSDRSAEADDHAYISAAHLLEVRPTVAAHVNGGFIPLTDDDLTTLVESGLPPFVEIAQVGSIRSTLHLLDGLQRRAGLDRLLVGTDTPSGYGILPLGVLKTLSDICSLAAIPAPAAWAVASGNAARAFRLEGHTIREGAPADLVVFDAALGSAAASGLEALERGELPGIALVVIEGRIRVQGSRNTTRATRVPRVVAHTELGWTSLGQLGA